MVGFLFHCEKKLRILTCILYLTILYSVDKTASSYMYAMF